MIGQSRRERELYQCKFIVPLCKRSFGTPSRVDIRLPSAGIALRKYLCRTILHALMREYRRKPLANHNADSNRWWSSSGTFFSLFFFHIQYFVCEKWVSFQILGYPIRLSADVIHSSQSYDYHILQIKKK